MHPSQLYKRRSLVATVAPGTFSWPGIFSAGQTALLVLCPFSLPYPALRCIARAWTPNDATDKG
jgi:hypothetical protein